MKNLFLGLVFLLTSFMSFGQLIINQEITNTKPYRVGDTLTMKYTVVKGSLNPQYLWMRFGYSTQHLQKLGPTVFYQGSTAQQFETYWPGYVFNPNGTIGVGDLYGQYQSSPWNYTTNQNWISGQFTTQRADSVINGLWAVQKFILLENSNYQNVHKLDLATATGTDGQTITQIGSQVLWLSFANADVKHGSSFKVKVGFPSGFDITSLKVQIMELNTDGTTNWTKPPVATKALNSAGEASFDQFNIGDKYGVYIVPTFGANYLNNIVTVTDAYRAFLAVTALGIDGTATIFGYPTLERMIGNITKGDNVFNSNDSYYMLAYVLGQDVSSKADIPTNASQSLKFFSAKQSAWTNLQPSNANNVVEITSANQTEVFSYAFGGDLDFSHSSNPATPISANSTNGMMNRTIATPAYYQTAASNATLSLSSKIEGGKVILSGNLSQDGLAGLQVIMKYDNSKLTLDNVIFDTGSTMTNFSTHENGRLTFGSIDQIKTGRIKVGTPYKLIFTSNVPLSNTSGLFYTELADAVDGAGNKVGLNVE